MKKIITWQHVISIFVILILSLSCNNQVSHKTDLTEKNLKGKVKSMTVATYSLIQKFGKIQKKDLLDKNIYEYDINGNQTEWQIFESDGTLSDKHSTKYNDKGWKIEEDEYSRTFGSMKIIYKYDEKGLLIEENNSDFKYIFYKYNLDGHLIERNKYNSSKMLTEKYIYKYDDNGNLIEYNSYEKDGSLYQKTIYKYDDNNDEIEQDNYISDGSLYQKTIYKYDDNNNEIEQKSFNSRGVMTNNTLSSYNEKGIKIEMRTGSEVYKYDGNGNEIEYYYGNPEDRTTYKYNSFDNTGNWTSKTEFQKNVAVSVTERLFEYY